MNSSIDDLLDHVDQWKYKVHEKLKGMTPLQRKPFWKQIHEEARAGIARCRSGGEAEAGEEARAENRLADQR